MVCRGVRGATVAEADRPEAIRAATRELLAHLIEANGLRPEDIASAVFSCTADLAAEVPAAAARELGWTEVAMLCTREMDVAGGLNRCIRVLIHWNTEKQPGEIRHVYLGAAGRLRPKWAWPADPP